LPAQDALGVPGAVLAAGISRALGRTALDRLGPLGIRGHLAAAETPPADEGAASAEQLPLARPLFEWLGDLLTNRAAVLAILGVACLAFLLLLPSRSAGPAARAPSHPAGSSGAASSRKRIEEALGATATLRCPYSAGTGFFVTSELLLTNEHVLCGGNEALQVTMRDGRKLAGQVVRRDDWLDVALVRVPGADSAALPLGDATLVGPGDRVLAIGNPRQLDFSVTQGIISHGERSMLGLGYLQFDANVNPGNSGGPLLDPEGHAIGIVSMMLSDSRGLSFALPINYAYEGPEPFVEVPAAKDRRARWKAFLSRMEEAENREVAQVSGAFRRPGLLAALVFPDGSVTAILVRRDSLEPTREDISLTLVTARNSVCSTTGTIERWKKVDAGPSEALAHSRFMRWMQRHRISSEVWVGASRLRWSGCPGAEEALGGELVLDGADPHADRAVLEATGRPSRS
jgi:serine protease Do